MHKHPDLPTKRKRSESPATFERIPDCGGFEVGLLINFHNWPLKDGGIKRLVNTKD